MLKKILLGSLLISSFNLATIPQVTLNVTPNNLTIGTPFSYNITLEMDNSLELIKIPLEENFKTNKSLNLIKNKTHKTSSNNKRIIKLNYKLSSFDLGEQLIPTQSIILKHSITNKYSKYSLPAYPIFITSVAALDNPENLTVKVSEALYFELNLDKKIIIAIIASLLILILATIYGYKFFKKRKTNYLNPSKNESIKKDPFEEFNIEINKNYSSISTLKIKDYYVKYSEIIKLYLAYILKTNTAELTSIELFDLAKETINEQDLRRLKFVLSFSDKVKFATYTPTENENKDLLEKAIDAITKLNHTYNLQTEKKETPENNINSKKDTTKWFLHLYFGY